jgi:hypothetical protein
LICSFNFLICLAVCLNIFTVINIKILTNSNQQTQSYKFTSHIAAFLSVILITEMLEICIQTSFDQNVQLILKSYLPVVYGTPLKYNGQKKKDRRTKNEPQSTTKKTKDRVTRAPLKTRDVVWKGKQFLLH